MWGEKRKIENTRRNAIKTLEGTSNHSMMIDERSYPTRYIFRLCFILALDMRRYIVLYLPCDEMCARRPGHTTVWNRWSNVYKKSRVSIKIFPVPVSRPISKHHRSNGVVLNILHSVCTESIIVIMVFVSVLFHISISIFVYCCSRFQIPLVHFPH